LWQDWFCYLHFFPIKEVPVMPAKEIEFKSPQYKLLHCARVGRQKWKAKCIDVKQSLKATKQNLANARDSRKRWRDEARQLRHQVTRLQQQVEELKKSD